MTKIKTKTKTRQLLRQKMELMLQHKVQMFKKAHILVVFELGISNLWNCTRINEAVFFFTFLDNDWNPIEWDRAAEELTVERVSLFWECSIKY